MSVTSNTTQENWAATSGPARQESEGIMMKFETMYDAFMAGKQEHERELMTKPFMDLAEKISSQLEALERRYIDLHSNDMEKVLAYVEDDYNAVIEAFQQARQALQIVINVTDTGDHILNPLNREFYHIPAEE